MRNPKNHAAHKISSSNLHFIDLALAWLIMLAIFIGFQRFAAGPNSQNRTLKQKTRTCADLIRIHFVTWNFYGQPEKRRSDVFWQFSYI